MPRVSIIIPTFNRSKYLELALESILIQEFKDFEIIVFDNASTDNTKEVIRKYNDNRINYYVNQKNLGVVLNHNLALQKCKGDFIHFFSDDDIMLPNCLELKLKAFDENRDAVLVHTNINIIDSFGNYYSNQHWALDWEFSELVMKHNVPIDGKEILKFLLNEWNFISMPTVMIKKELINDSNYMSTKLNLFCDYGYWCTLANLGQFVYLDEKTVNYRYHENNTIKQSSFKQVLKELQAIKKLNYGRLIYFLNLPFLKKKSLRQIELYQHQKAEFLLTKIKRKVFSKFSKD